MKIEDVKLKKKDKGFEVCYVKFEDGGGDVHGNKSVYDSSHDYIEEAYESEDKAIARFKEVCAMNDGTHKEKY